MPKQTAVVVGSGVIGLSCALRLLELGWAVHIVSHRRTPHTTSDVAAALVCPSLVPYLPETAERLHTWYARSLRAYRALGELHPATGISEVEVMDLSAAPEMPRPLWAEQQPDLEVVPPPLHLPEYTGAWRCKLPLVPMDRYMPWLERRCERLGATFEEHTLACIDEVDHPRVVNCSGLGARELCRDSNLFAIRGQLVRVENPGVKKVWCDDEGPRRFTYLIPRGDEVILGGTAQGGDERLEPDPAIEEAIIRRAFQIVPILHGAAVTGRAVGLRPGRPAVRLERERRGRTLVVHCYGHGGAGVSLAWGCADEVRELVE